MPAFKRKATSTQLVVKRRKYTPANSMRAAVAARNRMVSTVSAVPRPLMGFPNSKKVTMRYCSYQSDYSSTSGALNQQVVSMNDLNDPDTTGVGHQPLGYDQWRLFYEDYIVTEARITVQVTPAASQTTPTVAGLMMHDSNSTTATTFDALIEQGRSTWKVLPLSVATPMNKFYLKADLKKVFNVADVKDNKHRFGGTFGGSPNEENYFIFWIQSLDQATTTAVDLVYVVEYDVIVSSPKELAQS